MDATQLANERGGEATQWVVKGNYIRDLAAKAGYEQDYLAAEWFGIERSMYSKILSGKVQAKTPTMFGIAEKLGVPMEWLYHKLSVPVSS